MAFKAPRKRREAASDPAIHVATATPPIAESKPASSFFDQKRRIESLDLKNNETVDNYQTNQSDITEQEPEHRAPMDISEFESDLHYVLKKQGFVDDAKRETLVRQISFMAIIDPPLPDPAPSQYIDKKTSGEITDYLRAPDGWGPYVKAGLLSRVQLGRRDPKANVALDNWLRNPDNVLPDDICVRTQSEITELMLTVFPDPKTRPARAQNAVQNRARRVKLG